MLAILLTLTIFAISACGLFDYSHIPKEWEKIAKAECKKGQYITDQNVSEVIQIIGNVEGMTCLIVDHSDVR